MFFRHRISTFIALLLLLFSMSISAGVRGPSKYSGVVFFDRWDSCLLISGLFVTYVSENVKNDLRPYAGKAIEIDASEVRQRMNPGDAVVKKYSIVGPAPAPNPPHKLDGLEFTVKYAGGDKRDATLVVTVANRSATEVGVSTSELGITVLGNHKKFFSPSDGPSEAIITRVGLNIVRDYQSSWEDDGQRIHARFKVQGGPVPDRLTLKPNTSQDFTITFDLPAGEYQFLVGYGGGVHAERSLISNAVSFDIDAAGNTTANK